MNTEKIRKKKYLNRNEKQRENPSAFYGQNEAESYFLPILNIKRMYMLCLGKGEYVDRVS